MCICILTCCCCIINHSTQNQVHVTTVPVISTDNTSINNTSFVSVGNDESCSICTCRKRSHKLQNCQHKFCRDCIYECIFRQKKCPFCRQVATICQIQSIIHSTGNLIHLLSQLMYSSNYLFYLYFVLSKSRRYPRIYRIESI